jgi:hypothetical protein
MNPRGRSTVGESSPAYNWNLGHVRRGRLNSVSIAISQRLPHAGGAVDRDRRPSEYPGWPRLRHPPRSSAAPGGEGWDVGAANAAPPVLAADGVGAAQLH